MYLTEHAVSPAFRDEIARLLPGLGHNIAYWNMTGMLMFSAGAYSDRILIPAALIALVEEKKLTGKYCASKFLREYQRDVVDLDITAHTTTTCRFVTKIHWPADVAALLRAERRVVSGDRVLFSSGAKWRPEHTAQIRKDAQEEALEIMRDMGNHPACDLLALLNNVAPNRFNHIKKHLDKSTALVDTLPLSDSEKERQHTILKAIEAQAQPFYAPGQRTSRIFAINDCIARLQHDVRECMTQNWITCDIKSAQLCFVAKIWDVPAVSAFLSSGGSIWNALYAHMGLNKEDKPTLKNALYALIFGAGRDKIIEILGSRSSYDRFRSHPLIYQMLSARAAQLRKIRKEGGATDAFGTRLKIEYISMPGKHYSYDSSRKIMALVAQSYELYLLSPVIQLAKDCAGSAHEFQIMLWLHDGFSFEARYASERLSWAMRIKQAFDNHAKALGIVTELEISNVTT